jgi:hypothetical protein
VPQDTAPVHRGRSAVPTDLSLGLKVIHEPQEAKSSATQPSSSRDTQTVSIIFVHGLGGSTRDTWTHPESKTFWPSLLHEEDGFDNVRISTFGYRANFINGLRPKNILGIADFAKQLLDSLDLYYDKYGDVRPFFTRLNVDAYYICCPQYGWTGGEEGLQSLHGNLTRRQ